ncbi:hypothetical protein KEM56_007720 [Ascosphaera pollenicola]|nr:hypothetical protein KEM56_007720 [Ascosphaera pollenicola]
MTPIHESRNEANISPRTPSAPVWTASEWQELFTEPPRSLRWSSPSPSMSLQAPKKRHSDETIFDIYHAYERNGLHRPQSASSNWYQQRPSDATLVDGRYSFYGRGSRASSTTNMSIVKEYNAPTRQIDKTFERGKWLTEIPIFDATFAKIEWHYLSFDTREPELLAFPPENLRPPDMRRYSSPRGWSKIRKMLVMTMLSWVTSLAANAVGSYNCPMKMLMKEWGVSEVAYEVGLTTFCLGLAIAPMISAPLSEVTGRRAIFIASGCILASASVACGFANSYAVMLVCRLFAGIGASTFASIVAGVIGDMYAPVERNTPMALFSANALLGIGMGPFSTMFVVAKFSWRWAFWSQAIAIGIAVILLFAFLPETRASVLLSAKAKILNKYYEKLERIGMWGVRVYPGPGNSETHTRIARLRFMTFDDEERESLGKMIAVSCYRPWHMLFTEPIVFLFSSWAHSSVDWFLALSVLAL